jgi:hypothetical protein
VRDILITNCSGINCLIIADCGYLLIVPISGLIIVSVIFFFINVVSVINFHDYCFHNYGIEDAYDCNGVFIRGKIRK